MTKENNFDTFQYAFIVKDYKTYTNAEEAWYKFSGHKKGSILFVIVPNKDTETTATLNDLIDTDKWQEIVWFKSLCNYPVKSALKKPFFKSKLLINLYEGREYLYKLFDRLALDKIGKKYGSIPTVFSGHRNTQEHLAASLNPDELYIMDSGANIQKRIRSSGYLDVRKVGRRTPLKYLLNKFIALKHFDRSKTKLFTIYADTVKTKHEVVKNEFSYRKMKVKNMEVGTDIYFISSPVFAKKDRNISLQSYLEFVRDIFTQFDIDSRDVVYMPHPVHEDESLVEVIKKYLGCRIDSRKIPIETKITIRDKLPVMCISPYSSSVANISQFARQKFRLVYAWHFEFDCFEHLHKWKLNSLEKNSLIEIVPITDTEPLFYIEEGGCKEPVFKHFKNFGKEN